MAHDLPTSEQLVAEFITDSSDVMIRLDLSGRVTYLNPAGPRLLGIDAAACLGRPFAELVYPPDRERTEAALVGWIAHGAQGSTFENRLLRRQTGKAVAMRWTINRHDHAGSRSLTLFGRDITDQVAVEEALREEELLFRSLLEFAPDAIALVDRDGRIRLINRQIERYFGYRRDELLGQPIEILVPERFRKIHPSYRDGYFANPQVRPMGSGLEPNGQRKDGSEFPIDASLGPVETRHGLMTIAIVRDITSRRHTQAELLRRAAALEKAHAELQELDRFKDDFLSVLSHELRTPLNFIQGFASILDDEIAGSLTAEQHSYLSKILMGADRLLFLLNNLISMSQVLAGTFMIAQVPIPYGDLLRDSVEAYRPALAERGLTLEVETADLPEICMDPQQIMRVIGNLLDNAMKFTPSGGKIRLSARVDAERVRTEVSDTGVGIAPEDIPKLFTRFKQLDMTATRRAGGMGLGLSISKVIVERHGGEIGLDSQLGAGSTFWFTLPTHGSCDMPMSFG